MSEFDKHAAPAATPAPAAPAPAQPLEDENTRLAAQLRRWATNPETPQPPNMRAYYRLAAIILNKLRDGDAESCNMCEELRLFFSREQWDNPARAMQVALTTTTATTDYVSRTVGDMSRTVGDMVCNFWSVASEGQDISNLDGNVRYSFALVASGIL